MEIENWSFSDPFLLKIYRRNRIIHFQIFFSLNLKFYQPIDKLLKDRLK